MVRKLSSERKREGSPSDRGVSSPLSHPSPTPSSPTPPPITEEDEEDEVMLREKQERTLTKSISKSLLQKIAENDNKQLQLVFDAIDKNHDGSLCPAELEEFALELGCVLHVHCIRHVSVSVVL